MDTAGKALIAITAGDPLGIGPEIAVKAFAEASIFDCCRPLLVGDRSVIQRALEYCNLKGIDINPIDAEKAGGSLTQLEFKKGLINLADTGGSECSGLPMGTIRPEAGRAAFNYIKAAIEIIKRGGAKAVATCPINKESLRAADVEYIGHTEIFAGLTGAKDPLTMFETRGLRTFFLSRHVSLRKACEMVSRERIMDYIERCTAALAGLGVKDGVMAVAGLNPHSGEHGLFGDEEEREVVPAVEEMKRRGFAVEGPVSADSVYHQALKGRYNSVLSLYHDQGHIATKTLDFERTISVTHGLPFLRTSVDHGTAFDIAGRNIASAVSIIEAVSLAAKYTAHV